MRTFREAMIVSNNLKAMKNLLEFIEANGGDPGKFVDWFTSEENLMEAGPASNPLNLPDTSRGAGELGSYIGAVGGGLGGLITGAGRGISNVAGSFASGIAQGAKAGYRAVTNDLPSSAKNATDALKNLENRISQSAELKAMFKDPNFIPLLQNLQKTIANALVENRKSRSVINEAQKKSEYKKVFIKLAEAGIDPHEALQIYVENNFYMTEIFQSIANWFANIGTRWKERLRNISNKQDQDAIANAMTALGKLQKDIPAFGQKPSQEFQKFAQELAIAVNNATGGAHGAEAYKEITSDLKNRLKNVLGGDGSKIDQFDQNALVNIVVKKFDEFKKRSPILNRDDQQLEWVTFVAKEIAKNPSNVENVESMINGFNSEKFFLVDLLKNQGAKNYTDVKNKLASIADQNARFSLSSNLLQYASNYANSVKNDPAKIKQWFQGIVDRIDEIVKNPNNLEGVQGVMSGYVSEKEFYDNMAKNKIAEADIDQIKPKLDSLGPNKIRLIATLMQHAKKYAGLVKNDPTKMKEWYTQIAYVIKTDANTARQKAIELETKAAGGPAATKAKAYMDAVTGTGTNSKYDIIMDEEKDDFERQFQATYMAVGDNPDSGRQILRQTIDYFMPDKNKKDNVKLFAQAYEKALAEKIREWYDGVSGNNFASELQPILKTPTEQLKLVQKFNQALKAGTGKEEFWQDIGYKLRNNENIFESRKPKVDQQFLDSILGKTKNPQAGWFNF